MRTTAQPPARSPRVVGSAPFPGRVPATVTKTTVAAAEKPTRRGLLAYWFVPAVRTRPIRVVLAEGGYFGATLMIGGMAVLLGVYWQEFTDVIGASMLAAVAGGLRDLAALRAADASPRSHVSGALFALASGSAFAAVGVLDHRHAWLAASAVGLVVAMFGYALLPTVSGLLAGTALSVVLAVSIVDEVMRPTPLSVSAALLSVGSLLGLLSATGLVRQQSLGLSIGAVIAIVGAQQPLADADTVGWAYALSLAVGVACLALYLQLPVAALLIVGVVGIGVAVLEATWDLTSGPAGLAATLAATGATLCAASGIGLYLWRTRGERVAQARKIGRYQTRRTGP
jgi:hypothetical protein